MPTSGPFPSDRFTVADRSQNTGLRVNLPPPDCRVRPSDCEDLEVINTLDGFNLQPRLSIPFDGAIDVETVTSETVFLISLGSTRPQGDRGGRVVGINQVVWDTFTHTLHVESDELLDQHTRYALIVTGGLRDASGDPVEATEAFRRFRQTVRGPYKQALRQALHAARRVGVREGEIVTASVFTTQSATAISEKIRDQIKAATPEPADFLLGPGGTRTVFPLANVASVIFNAQTGDDPPAFTPVTVNLSLLRRIPGAVDRIAFGKYVSPDYEVHPGEYIPQVATRTGVPVVQSWNEIYFNLFLPSGPMPAGGWPVAIFAHGGGGNKNSGPIVLSHIATQAANGIATILINDVGHGFGPLGTLTVNLNKPPAVTFLAGGRGRDQDGDHIIGDLEGIFAMSPRAIILHRDAETQTVVDLMQLVRIIQVGVDVDGDGIRDLDPSRIYVFGQSFGGMISMQLLAVEPDVMAGVSISAAPFAEFARLSPVNRQYLQRVVANRAPSLLNPPGVTSIEAVPVVSSPHFDENLPLRDGVPFTVGLQDGTRRIIQAPVTNTIPGATELQEVLGHVKWVMMSGVPLAYAPHLWKAPLSGVPAKSVIFMFAKGDQETPNPTQSGLIRAGDLVDRTTYYRHDLAFAENPTLRRDPHGFTNSLTFGDIAIGAQQQIATFFASDGSEIIHPEPARFFEVPIQGPLPEALNFIP